MNVGMIFLFLLVGAVIGYEFGKYHATQALQGMLDKLVADMKAEAEKRKAEKEEKRKEAWEVMHKAYAEFEEYFRKKREVEAAEQELNKELESKSRQELTPPYHWYTEKVLETLDKEESEQADKEEE